MAIKCPACQHTVAVKGLHPGHFTPKCPLCHHKFALVVPEDGGEPVVQAVDEVALAKAKQRARANEIAEALGLELPKPKPKAKPRVQQSAVGATMGGPGSGDSQGGVAVAEPSPSLHATSVPDEGIPSQPPMTIPKIDGGASEPPEEDLRGALGGYDIIQKLGHGGMGAVYLARQVSLDRHVALKVMKSTWANDPIFVARFTREAFAAAQLTHHNVVQIHDIGEDKRQQFFSMEFVEGQSLGDVIKDKGRVDNETAVGYVLQAARGLKFAHEHGMVHRDVKPENLLVNDDGIVKVADLGLVKTPGVGDAMTRVNGSPDNSASMTHANVTQLNVSMGTPLYMAPEQATNAHGVDARADIYSLGCTLYHLLVGRPPFVGNTAVEVITKHQIEPVVPPETIVKRVTPALSQIVLKMLAKDPFKRYQNMTAVIKDLEQFLGVESGKPFAPSEEHVDDLEREAATFNNASWAKLRGKLIWAFYGLTVVGIIASAVLGHVLIAGGLLGVAVLTTACYVLLQGAMQKTFLFTKIRQLVFGARIFDWLMWIVGLAMLGGLLYVTDLHLVWLGAAILSAGLAAGFYFSVDLLAGKQRSYPVRAVNDMIKGFRIKGLDEDAVRSFVAKFSGERWEEFYEALFGYEDKLQARTRWGKGEGGKERPKFGAWRDSIISWIDHRVKWRQEKKHAKYLQKIESRKLTAEGLDKTEAKKKARKVADKLLHRAAKVKTEQSNRLAETAMPGFISPKLDADSVQVVRRLDDETVHGEDGERKHESYLQRKYGGPIGLVFGPQVRFALAAILLIGFVLWLHQNKSFDAKALKDRALQEINARHDSLSGEAIHFHDPVKAVDVKFSQPKRPLELPVVPSRISGLFSTYNAGLAGAVLLLSCFFRGTKLGLFVIPAAAIIFIGQLIPGVPEVAAIQKFAGENFRAMPAAMGGAVAVLGFIFARK